MCKFIFTGPMNHPSQHSRHRNGLGNFVHCTYINLAFSKSILANVLYFFNWPLDCVILIQLLFIIFYFYSFQVWKTKTDMHVIASFCLVMISFIIRWSCQNKITKFIKRPSEVVETWQFNYPIVISKRFLQLAKFR